MLLGSKPHLSWRASLTVLALGIVVALPMVSQVWAHKVNVFAWVEGDTVFVEGYFPGGKKSQDSLVEVFNPAGTKLLEGRTNKKGEFSFKIPERTDLKIVLTSSMGQRFWRSGIIAIQSGTVVRRECKGFIRTSR